MTEKLIDRNPDVLGGTPVFSGTRVPIRIPMEHVEASDTRAARYAHTLGATTHQARRLELHGRKILQALQMRAYRDVNSESSKL